MCYLSNIAYSKKNINYIEGSGFIAKKFKKSNVYIDGLILKSTKNIGMITIEHYERKFGESNYNIKKLLILWSNMVLNFSFKPFRFASIFGIVLKFIILIFRKKNKIPQFEILEKTQNEKK